MLRGFPRLGGQGAEGDHVHAGWECVAILGAGYDGHEPW